MPRIPKQKTRRQLEKELDAITSKVVKKRDRYVCQRCRKKHDKGSRGLHCSHYFSRRYRGTRWELANLDSLCLGCHRLCEGDKQGWYSDYKKNQLGDSAFEYLRVKAYGITKFTSQDLEFMIDIMKGNL